MASERKRVIIGYGRMGHLIEEVLNEEGKKVYEIIDPKYPGREWTPDSLKDADLAFCFTDPDTGYETTKRVLESGTYAAVGTTKFYLNSDGTLNQEMIDELDAIAKEYEVVGLIAPNFSLGVTKFVETIRRYAEFYSKNGYRPFIIEVHHTGKTKDVSGTALGLIGSALLEAYPDKKGLYYGIDQAIWPENYAEEFNGSLLDVPFDNSIDGFSADEMRKQIISAEQVNKIPIIAIRYKDIPGRHRVIFKGDTDVQVYDNVVTDRKIFARDAVKVSDRLFDLDPGLYFITELI